MFAPPVRPIPVYSPAFTRKPIASYLYACDQFDDEISNVAQKKVSDRSVPITGVAPWFFTDKIVANTVLIQYRMSPVMRTDSFVTEYDAEQTGITHIPVTYFDNFTDSDKFWFDVKGVEPYFFKTYYFTDIKVNVGTVEYRCIKPLFQEEWYVMITAGGYTTNIKPHELPVAIRTGVHPLYHFPWYSGSQQQQQQQQCGASAMIDID